MDYRFKICIFGDGGVGKTTLVTRYLTGVFDADIPITLGMKFFVKKLEIIEKKCSLQIWDFAGELEFRELLPSSVIGSSGGIFMFDITRYSSIKNLKDYITIFKENNNNPETIPILLIGGKLDLENKRAISKVDSQDLAKQYGFSDFIECSSKTGENVNKIFITLTQMILEKVKFGINDNSI